MKLVRICDAADKYGIKCMIGCMLESKVSVSAGVHLAAARSCVYYGRPGWTVSLQRRSIRGGSKFSGSKISMPGRARNWNLPCSGGVCNDISESEQIEDEDGEWKNN